MKAIDLFVDYYPELTKQIEKTFPDFLVTAEEVKVIPWREEFCVADYNPEVIDEIEFWNTLFDNNLISEKEWREKISNIKTFA